MRRGCNSLSVLNVRMDAKGGVPYLEYEWGYGEVMKRTTLELEAKRSSSP